MSRAKSARLFAEALEYLPGDVNSPVRAFRAVGGEPFFVDRARGARVWDVDGNQFLDFAAGIAVTATGHSHPKVVQAIKDQTDKFLHISADFYHESWITLGEHLDRVAPFKEDAVSFMTNSGTESVEAAIKLARYHTGVTEFIGFLGAFHGRTLGSRAA